MKAVGKNALSLLWNQLQYALSGKLDNITTSETSILKVTNNGTSVNIDIDNSETIILYCGDSKI